MDGPDFLQNPPKIKANISPYYPCHKGQSAAARI